MKNYILHVEIRFLFCQVKIPLKHSRFCHVIKCWLKKKEKTPSRKVSWFVCYHLGLKTMKDSFQEYFQSFPKIALVAK